MRLIPVMLALLLALSPGAVALQASAPQPAVAEQTDTVSRQTETDTVRSPGDRNTTSVMMLGTEPARTAFDSPSIALGSSLAMDRGGFRTQLSVNALDQELDAAKTAEKKKQVLNGYRFRIENHIISLKARERRVTNAFMNGTVSKREYLRTLGQIDAEAEQLRKAINALKKRSASMKFSVDHRTLETKLVTIEGPVRNQISKVLQGRADSIRVYVSAADTGIVLSAIINGMYVRETYRADNRDPSKTVSIGAKKAREKVMRSQYPWVVDGDHWTGRGVRTYPSIQVIKFRYDHPHGNLTAYIDTGTASIYREIQYKRLTGEHSLPPGPGVTNSSENLTLVVNRTYPGGPLQVKLTNGTGAPVRGQITVAGVPVGRTNADGTLWTLGPAKQFQVSATYRGRTVNVTATPINSS